MSNKDSTSRTIIVALVLCFVCSVVVSTAAVSLKGLQKQNKQLDFNKNILMAAGLYQEGVSVDEQFSAVETRFVEIASGSYVEGDQYKAEYDQWKAAKDTSTSRELSGDEDLAKISRLEDVSKVFLVQKDGELDKVILPIRGYGLWSTLYGFIALEADLNTVAGLGFYQHGETPGLGGEVDNPAWKALWEGKELYGGSGSLAITVIKGKAPSDSDHKIDGLSGATLTSKGVDNLIQFWLGENGFGQYLANLEAGEA